jgi:TldD protein
MRLATTLAGAVSGTDGAAVAPKKDWRLSRAKVDEIAGYAIQRSPRELPLAEKIELCRRGDRAARAELPAAKQVTTALIDALRKICVINSEGTVASDRKTYLTYFCQVVGEKNPGKPDARIETSYEGDGGYVGLEFFDTRPPEEIATECAKRVKILLDAEPAPAGTMPVVLAAEAGGTMIHEAVGHGLEADLACNGLSVYQGKVGQQVASPLISVIDDGTMPARRGSFAVDDEGTPSQKTTLIENGVLKGYLVDRISAMKFDMPSTGNGRRETFRHKPIVRMTNTYIAPGKDDPAQILADTRYGVFVKAMGGGQVNTVTGDFVFAVTEGYLIQDGKLGAPIRGATLVGNGPKVMSMVDRVGTDLGFAVGTCGKDGQGAPVTDAQPTIRIPELTVGGEVPMDRYFKNAKT